MYGSYDSKASKVSSTYKKLINIKIGKKKQVQMADEESIDSEHMTGDEVLEYLQSNHNRNKLSTILGQ